MPVRISGMVTSNFTRVSLAPVVRAASSSSGATCSSVPEMSRMP